MGQMAMSDRCSMFRQVGLACFLIGPLEDARIVPQNVRYCQAKSCYSLPPFEAEPRPTDEERSNIFRNDIRGSVKSERPHGDPHATIRRNNPPVDLRSVHWCSVGVAREFCVVVCAITRLSFPISHSICLNH
jgi:hypothetical protein